MHDTSAHAWDLFISHAVEDKKSFVEPLALALSRFGLKVWYDDYTLKIGDSLSRSIDEGLAHSKYGLSSCPILSSRRNGQSTNCGASLQGKLREAR